MAQNFNLVVHIVRVIHRSAKEKYLFVLQQMVCFNRSGCWARISKYMHCLRNSCFFILRLNKNLSSIFQKTIDYVKKSNWSCNDCVKEIVSLSVMLDRVPIQYILRCCLFTLMLRLIKFWSVASMLFSFSDLITRFYLWTLFSRPLNSLTSG